MKILYITNSINGSGGLERVLSVKASYLAEHYDYSITILCLNDGHLNSFYKFNDKIELVSIQVGGNPINYFLNYKKGIQRVIDQKQPDIISVCDDGLKGFLLPKIIDTKAKWIYERHASIELNRQSGYLGNLSVRLMKLLSSNFDSFVVLTDQNVSEWNSKNVTVIPNPLSFPIDKSSLLNQKRVIAIGSHSYNKGFDLLLKVWESLQPKYPDWTLSIFGKFDDNETYLQMAKERNLKEVIFQRPVKDIKYELLNSSILTLPSRSEGFGMVLIEAMACGVPCVSFDCPSGPRDIISHAENGFLVENGNIEQFASFVESLMVDNENRLKFGEQAIRDVEKYKIENVSKLWDQLFNNLVYDNSY